MENLCPSFRISRRSTRTPRPRNWHALLFCLALCLIYSASAQTTPSDPVFEYGFTHVNQANADAYVVESRGVRKYSEWQSPPITYWGPAQNDVEGVLVYRFALPQAAGSFYLKANDSSWDFNNEPGGFGRGCSALEVSRDGVNWIVLRNSLDSRQWGVDWSYEGDLPPEMIGATEVWLRLRFLCEGAPNSSYTVTQFGRSSSAATENVFDFRAYPVLRGQPPRFNTFMLQSSQAGSTADIDNLRVIDLDTGEVVYSNDFSDASKATDNLQLFHFPQGGGNTTNFVVNGPMTRVVDGKLRLETTGFGANGSGGYESHSEAEYTQPLPHNFLVEFDAVRLQWAGHFHFHVSYRDPTDPPSSHELFGAYTTNRAAPYRLDWLRMASSGSWFQQYGVHTDAATTNSSWPVSFPAPPGSLQQTHKLGISLSNNLASFYLDGQLLNSADISEYLGASGDFDNDGVNDYREQRDGTDPNDPDSFNPLSKGLLAHFPFSGHTSDESGFNRDLAVTGATEFVSDRFSGSASALSFNEDVAGLQAVGSGVDLSGSSLTVAFWYRKAAEPVGDWVFYVGSEGGSGKSVHVALDYPQDVRFSFYYNDLDYTASPSQVTDRWYHLVGTYDADSGLRRLFINGVQVASDTPPEGFTGNDVFAFGKFGTVMDDVRIYNRALSAAEVGQLYHFEADSLDSDGDGLTDAWERGFGRYQMVRGNFTWPRAKVDAEAKGGHLVTITSAAEQAFIVNLPDLQPYRGADESLPRELWTGGREEDPSGNGGFSWVTGEAWSYSNFPPSEPASGADTGIALHAYPTHPVWGERSDGPWNDLEESAETHYILEFGYPTDPNDPDSDDDGFNDKVESDAGSDPNSASSVPGFADSDGDGVTDHREGLDGTDPNDPSKFEPLSVNLLAHYTFDNTWNDSSGYRRHVLAPYTAFGAGLRGVGQSLSLTNGNSQANYWNDPNNTNSPNRISTYSLSIWMRPSSLTQANDTWNYLFSAPNNAAFLRFGNSSLGDPGSKVLAMGYEWPGLPGYSFTTDPINRLRANNWQQVVGVQEGSSTKIYLNGRLVAASTNGSIPFDPWNYTIGNLFNTDTYQGLLDEARIYGRALSATEVRELYSSEARDMDSDGDGLADVRETATGQFVSAEDTGSDPYEFDSSGDGISDGEAINGNLNPLVDQRPVLDLLRETVESDAGRFGFVTQEQNQQENNTSRTNGRADVIANPAAYGLYTADSIMDLRMGGVMIQKLGSNAVVTFQPQTTADLTQPFTNNGTPITNQIPMPGNKGFIRIRVNSGPTP